MPGLVSDRVGAHAGEEGLRVNLEIEETQPVAVIVGVQSPRADHRGIAVEDRIDAQLAPVRRARPLADIAGQALEGANGPQHGFAALPEQELPGIGLIDLLRHRALKVEASPRRGTIGSGRDGDRRQVGRTAWIIRNERN